jgi:hypothetical protein
MADSKFRPHPLVEELTKRGDAAVKLLGYFGSANEGVVKFYPSLDDLSAYYEIPEADILHVEDARAEELPHGGSAIWVKANARVERCISQRTSTEARFLTGEIAMRMARGPAVTYRALGHLGYQPDPNTWDGPACKYSVWPCSVAWGGCLASGDDPCVETEQWGCNVYTAKTCQFTCAGYTCDVLCVSAGCPATVKWCTGLQLTRCCEVYSRDVCGR